jgi:hypothetical protein
MEGRQRKLPDQQVFEKNNGRVALREYRVAV